MSASGVVVRWFLEETNFVVTSLTACCLLYARSTGVAYFALGAVSCSLSVKAIKRIIRQVSTASSILCAFLPVNYHAMPSEQPRPVHPISKKKTYGMPSTHSATISHFGVYIPLACAYLPIHPSLPRSAWTRILPPLIVIPWALAIIRSRIWLGHHTWQQCTVGCLYGIAFSLTWFALWINGANYYGQIIETEIHRILSSL